MLHLSNQILGLTGNVYQVNTVKPYLDTINSQSSMNSKYDDIDLKQMAEWALHYLIETPRKHLGYEPVFQCSPLEYPPVPEGQDVVVACDTDARMDWEWYYMRDITGSDRGREVEEAFHLRIRDYIDSEGKVWSHIGCYNENLTEAVYNDQDNVIHIWGATKILKSLSEDYARNKNQDTLELARKVMKALKKLTTWDEQGRCYFPGGMGALNHDLTIVPNFWNKHPAPIVEPLVTYWLSTGDEEGLEFAIAYTEGMIHNIQPGGIQFMKDGSVDYGPGNPHSHATMHAVWGVAHLGSVLGETRYVEFSKKVWDWMNSRSTGTGWFPAMPDNCNETCLISDMISIACLIGKSGYPEYYDYAERFMRNYIHNLQFIVTPEFEEYYRQLNMHAGEKNIQNALNELRKFQGGIIGGSGLNDYENELLGGVSGFKMFGCCAPEGMRAIYTCWTNTLEYRTDSHAHSPQRLESISSLYNPSGVYVNLSFSCDTEWAQVVSHFPREGKLSISAKKTNHYFIRVPHWALASEVKSFVNGVEIAPTWSKQYIHFDAKVGDELSITYPLISFTQEVGGLWGIDAKRPDLVMKFEWLGNMVIAADPPTHKTALFTGAPRHLPHSPVT